MCVEISSKQQFNKMDITSSSTSSANKKISYSIKKLLKQVFKQNKSQQFNPMESLESLDNNINENIEFDCASMESNENDINERLFEKQTCQIEDFDFITTVPVHFVRTEQGTFFWTAYNQATCMQNRWAQA